MNRAPGVDHAMATGYDLPLPMRHQLRALIFVSLVAALHAALFIAYQRPDWDAAWTDQGGYKRLGEVLAETGRFTRYPDAAPLVPETIRTPGYPLFVAAVYRLFGVSHLAVAIAQALVFLAICVLVYLAGRQVASERVALGAAAATALFPPIPYFGALVLTEVWATFLLTLAMVVYLGAARTPSVRRFAFAGFLLGATALTRPAFVLLPIFLAGALGIAAWAGARPSIASAGLANDGPFRHGDSRRLFAGGAILLVVFGVTLLPWLAYNYVHLQRVTIAPAGGIGRGIWEGSWQGKWPGRLQARLTDLADRPVDDSALDREIEALSRETGYAAEPMLLYVHQWRDIRRIWTEPQDPRERVNARIVADAEYLRVGLTNIQADRLGHIARRVTHGAFVLWAADIPVRYTDINSLPVWVIRVIWLAQVALIIAAAAGVAALCLRGLVSEATLLVTPLVYVTLVHLPLLTEARQSLPSKPIVLLLAAIGVASVKWTVQSRTHADSLQPR